MAKKLDPRLIEILTKYGEDPNEALWDCHGTWVAYHKAIERIAAQAGVEFDHPDIVIATDTVAVICVTGKMGDRHEWSFGEASPRNNKNAYTWAMAEKRGKDRVVLKLVGLHGLVYSEEESDDFKREPSRDMPKKVSAAQLKKDGAWDKTMFRLSADFADVSTPKQLEELKESYRAEARAEGWNWGFMTALGEKFAELETELMQRIELENHPINGG